MQDGRRAGLCIRPRAPQTPNQRPAKTTGTELQRLPGELLADPRGIWRMLPAGRSCCGAESTTSSNVSRNGSRPLVTGSAARESQPVPSYRPTRQSER
jgi:hypothetical protein